MVRQIIYPTNNEYVLNLPDELIGKQVEILAFELETEDAKHPNLINRGNFGKELNDEKNTSDLKKELDEFYNKFQIDMSDYKFNRDEANER
jgi:hypothetical protein